MEKQIDLVLEGCRPFSINSAYYKKTFTITRECRNWRDDIFRGVKTAKNMIAIHNFRKCWEKIDKPAGIYIKLSYGIPKEFFFTKAGDINIRSMELTNVEKLLVDILFDKRFYNRGELDNLNINDKYIVKCDSEKIPTKDWTIKVRIGMIDLRKHWEVNNAILK